MKIQKFYHSCLLIEESGKRILIDPGSWTFSSGAVKVSDIPKLDAVFITHSHGDHCVPEAAAEFQKRDNCPVYYPADLSETLTKAGIKPTKSDENTTIAVGDVKVEILHGPHERLPVPVPENIVLYVGSKLLHPGDSFSFKATQAPDIFAMPFMAPWGSMTQAVDLTISLKPKHVIPIHDGFIEKNFLDRLHSICAEVFKKAGIQFHPLKPGQILEV